VGIAVYYRLVRWRIGRTVYSVAFVMIKVGNRVRIKNYSKTLNGEKGTVVRRDGYYVYVYPDCQPNNTKYPLELYDCELEKLPCK